MENECPIAKTIIANSKAIPDNEADWKMKRNEKARAVKEGRR